MEGRRTRTFLLSMPEEGVSDTLSLYEGEELEGMRIYVCNFVLRTSGKSCGSDRTRPECERSNIVTMLGTSIIQKQDL
jgi:hypothetical protein